MIIDHVSFLIKAKAWNVIMKCHIYSCCVTISFRIFLLFILTELSAMSLWRATSSTTSSCSVTAFFCLVTLVLDVKQAACVSTLSAESSWLDSVYSEMTERCGPALACRCYLCECLLRLIVPLYLTLPTLNVLSCLVPRSPIFWLLILRDIMSANRL